MTAFTTLVIKHGDEAAATVADRLAKPAAHAKEAITALQAELSGLASGARSGRLTLTIQDASAGDRASATITVGTESADDTVVIGDVTLTWKASPSGESEVDIGGTSTISATNLAAAINAHTQLGGVVTATSAAAVVTVTAALPGRIGEQVTLVETGSSVTVSSARLTGVTANVQTTSRDHSFGVA